jgi:hypothetical protein
MLETNLSLKNMKNVMREIIQAASTYVIRAHREWRATPNSNTTQNISKMLSTAIVTGHLVKHKFRMLSMASLHVSVLKDNGLNVD